MKLLLKKTSILIAIILSIVLVYSCNKDKDEVSNMNGNEVLPILSSQLKIEFDKLHEVTEEAFNLKSDDLRYVKNSNILLDNSQSSNRWAEKEIEIISIQTSVVDRKNLNEVFSLIDKSKTVLALTLLEDDNKDYDGLIIHYSDSKGNLKLEAYKKINDERMFELVNLPVNLVTGFTLDNLLFVARNIFPKRNLITFGVSGIDNIKYTNTNDNISLLHFASRYNLLPSDGRYKELINQNVTVSGQCKEAPGGSNGGSGGLSSKVCAVAVHHCNNATETRTQCHPFSGGCKEPVVLDCSKKGTETALQENGMYDEYQVFISHLVDERLYSFRDWLETTPKGEFYSVAYYSLSAHFIESLDIDLLSDIVSASFEMSRFVSAIQNDNPSYVLNQEIFDTFVDILQKSAQKSQSIEYKEIVASMVEEIQVYKSKNVQEIKSLLSEE